MVFRIPCLWVTSIYLYTAARGLDLGRQIRKLKNSGAPRGQRNKSRHLGHQGHQGTMAPRDQCSKVSRLQHAKGQMQPTDQDNKAPRTKASFDQGIKATNGKNMKKM